MKPLAVLVFLIVAVLPASTQSTKCTVEGVVEDAAGRPMPGATVVILQAESDRTLDDNLPVLVLDGGSSPRLVDRSSNMVELPRIKTGADGRFRFEAEIPTDRGRVDWVRDRKGRTCRIPPLVLMAFTPELSTSAWFQPGLLPEGATRTDPVTLVLQPRVRLEVQLLDAAVPARSRVRFPALQAGRYLLGYVPEKKTGERNETPGAPRSQQGNRKRGFWRGALGRLSGAGPSGRWRPVRVVRGANEVLLDTATPREGGTLVIRPAGRGGKLLPEFSATLATQDDSCVWAERSNRSAFVAGDDGTIRIDDVPSGVYEMRLSPPWPDLTISRVQLVAVPRHGTATLEVRFDLDPPDVPWPPRLVDRAFAAPGVR